jgi:hypothetical protein
MKPNQEQLSGHLKPDRPVHRAASAHPRAPAAKAAVPSAAELRVNPERTAVKQQKKGGFAFHAPTKRRNEIAVKTKSPRVAFKDKAVHAAGKHGVAFPAPTVAASNVQ